MDGDPAAGEYEDRGNCALVPEWIIECGSGSVVGLLIDDGCFVVLMPDGDVWKTIRWIPKRVAQKIATLLGDPRLKN